MKNLIFSLIILFPFISFGQMDEVTIKQIDSIKNVIKNAKHDSIKVLGWRDWDNLIYVSDPELDLELNNKIEAICSKNLKKKLNKKEKHFFSRYLSFSYNNYGIIYKNKGDYASAVEFYTKSLKIYDKIGEKKGAAGCLGNIGIIYKNQEEYDRAIEYYNQCLKIQKEMKDEPGIAGTLINLGMAYSMKKELDKALDYYLEGLIIYERLGIKRGMGITLNNIGIIYFDKGEMEKALDFHTRCLKIQEEIGNKKGVSASLNNLGLIYQRQNNYTKALEVELKALELAKETGAAIETKDAANSLFNTYKKIGKHKEALEMFELYVATRDTLDREENEKEVLRQEYDYKYEKQSLQDSLDNAKQNEIKNAQIAQQDAEIKARKTQQYFLFGGLALVLIFAFFIYNRFKLTQRQKHIIEEKEKETQQQKHIIEEKHKEITDSINYAKRIQEAILPSRTSLVTNLRDGFVLYKPKDIVAGDFYWLEKFDEKIFLAAADCTGHGVPGAMVSVVCSNALTKSLLEEGISDTGKLLDKTRELVIEKFSKSEENVKDGMDISLCRIDFLNFKLQWSGANNPLWIVRNNELMEIKPDKQPIGNYTDSRPFTTHDILLQKNDTLYIFTDGYQDQFGGDKKKKFKASRMKEIIVTFQRLSMDEQKVELEKEFDKWRGNLEQIDDVCVIGIRI